VPYFHERNFGCRISDEYTFRGLRMLVMENELLRVSVLLDKGCDIYELLYKPLDVDFLWRSPLGVRPPMTAINSLPLPEGNFADYYEGGWQEVLPNGGRVCTYRGAVWGLHGEVWGIPWRHAIVEDSPEVVSARMWVRTYRTPFLLERTMTLRSGSAVLEIDETLTNEGEEPMELMWGHHPAFGPPFLSEHCVIQCGARRVVVDPNVGEASRFAPDQEFPWPVGIGRNGQEVDLSKIVPASARVSDMTYLADLQEAWYAVTNRWRRVGIGMAWDLETFPYIWCWMSLGGDRQWPSWGRYYALAMEPFSSYPAILTEAIKRGTQMRMEPGEQRRTWLRAVAYQDVEGVARITPEGQVEAE